MNEINGRLMAEAIKGIFREVMMWSRNNCVVPLIRPKYFIDFWWNFATLSYINMSFLYLIIHYWGRYGVDIIMENFWWLWNYGGPFTLACGYGIHIGLLIPFKKNENDLEYNYIMFPFKEPFLLEIVMALSLARVTHFFSFGGHHNLCTLNHVVICCMLFIYFSFFIVFTCKLVFQLCFTRGVPNHSVNRVSYKN